MLDNIFYNKLEDGSYDSSMPEGQWSPYVAVPALLGAGLGAYYSYNTIQNKDPITLVLSSGYIGACTISFMIAGGTIGFIAEELKENPVHTITKMVTMAVGGALGSDYGFNHVIGSEDRSLYAFNYLFSGVGLATGGAIGYVVGSVLAELIGKDIESLKSYMDDFEN